MLKASQGLVQMIEEMAANAWPATVNQQIGSWRLRASGGITKRANSVLTLGEMPAYEAWLDEVTAFYHRRALPVRFQLSEASPEELDCLLEGLGYASEVQSAVHIATCEAILRRDPRGNGYSVTLSDHPDLDWFDAFLHIEGHPACYREFYKRISGMIGPYACYVKVNDGDQIVGVGTAVSERGWTGLLNIATAESHRCKGVATQAVQALAAWSSNHGASSMYLQVVADNVKALALYGKMSFEYLYSYHYRTKYE